MAASMMRRHASAVRWGSHLWKAPSRQASGLYYVLLPEIPPDSAETNAVMRCSHLPDFPNINPDKCVTGAAKLAIEFETHLGNHVEKLKDLKNERTFETVFHPLEEISVPLNYAWRTAKNLSFVKANNGYRSAFARIHPQVERAKNERWVSEPLYYAVKEVSSDPGLDEAQRRLVDLYLLEGKLNGITLQGKEKKRFTSTLKILAQERFHFRKKVMICQDLFQHILPDSVVQDLPRYLLTAMAADRTNPSRGPWKLTLQKNLYSQFLTHCRDRNQRWNAWNAYHNRASVNFNDQNLGNHKLLDEIRTHRRDIAQLLGYDNFAEMSMETKMAGSLENVLNMIETFKGKFKPLAYEEIAALHDFATKEGFPTKLQMWDISYWRQRQKEALFGLDENEVAEYFPLEATLEGLFTLCSRLFGISIKEAPSDIPTWHPTVRVFNVYDEDDAYVSTFFFDPFARPGEKSGGAWMEMGRDRCDVIGTLPFSYLVMNLPPPLSPDMPTLMRFSDVLTLFHEFGHGLQQMLTVAPYSELSGQRNVEWDAVMVCAKFMQRWLLQPHVLRSLSSHFSSGEPLSDKVIDRLLKAEKHMSGFDTMQELYFSAYDMELHISKNQWHDAMQRTWKEFMPLPLDPDDSHPCSLTEVVSDQSAAAYYSIKWSEMIAADVFSAFEEAGLSDEDKVAAVGARFRDTFLKLGGSVPASEVFRRFRGRDPSLDALQIYHGVK